jgi:hypothetical protein
VRRIVRNTVILAGLVGAAVAIRGYLAQQEASGSGGEPQISYSDGSMNTLKPPESEEITAIAGKLIETGL